MGYRSQVRSLIFGPADKLQAFITSESLIFGSKVFQDSDFVNAMRKYAVERNIYCSNAQKTVSETIHVLDLYGDSWKWYEGYDDVRAWNAFTEAAEKFGLDTEFLRIGEETNDIEHTSTSNSDWLLSVTRSINNEMNQVGEDLPIFF